LREGKRIAEHDQIMNASRPSGLGERVRLAVRGLTPGYFAIVMASGIISVGMLLNGHDTLSMALLIVCAVSYIVLIILTGWRLLAYRHEIVSDFTDSGRAFGFFTFIAGTDGPRRPARYGRSLPPHWDLAHRGDDDLAGARLRHSLDGGPEHQPATRHRQCQRHAVHMGGGEPIRGRFRRLARAGFQLAT
jgi:hypothetical protein